MGQMVSASDKVDRMVKRPLGRSYAEFVADDGTTLRGICWGGSDRWVLLVHDLGEDLDAWQPLEAVLAESGCSRLAFDLRGHGASDDTLSNDRTDLDIEAAARFSEEAGAKRICVLSAGRSGIVALGLRRERPFEAMALLSPGPLEGRDPSSLRGQGTRKLFVVGSQDETLAKASSALHSTSIGWCYAVSFPTARQGCSLLEGAHAIHTKEHLASFVREFAYDAEEAWLARQSGNAGATAVATDSGSRGSSPAP
jgi:pimeloyl-ACP methyl ester carboxylesterase